MSKEIKIGKISVPVSDEFYKEYYQMKRRQRYLEEDVKVGRIDVDMENEKVTFVPNKEDSLQRLIDLGADYEDELSVEDLVVDKAMLLILQEAMKELDRQEKELIHDLFYEDMTVREVAKKNSTSHVTVMKRRDKILDKLRKFF
ncbi:RNA polymerase sigma factor [Alkalicella caledoniensis]|uniref:RNA polymerase sigma factor n=1 Tax=Alkalicella caledoniensis TaxID=2731377 RepID=UPI001BCEBFDC|nr:sigma factor-like helix-turn-helix DNA-binding protein [Alkalicella caledoniensis]